LFAMIALAWLSMLLMAMQHSDHGASGMSPMGFDLYNFLLTLIMWWCMVLAMMLPSALPALEVLEELNDTARRQGAVAGHPAMFALGFIVVWFGFGFMASAAQFALHNQALLAPTGKSSSPALSATLFIMAGLYQWTPLKNACLSKCRSPMSFFLSCWEAGNPGFRRMGRRMGRYCLGCCWAMMLLMFALGVMNLLWMAALALYMYVEKNWIRRRWFDRASGIVLVFTGCLILVLVRPT